MATYQSAWMAANNPTPGATTDTSITGGGGSSSSSGSSGGGGSSVSTDAQQGIVRDANGNIIHNAGAIINETARAADVSAQNAGLSGDTAAEYKRLYELSKANPSAAELSSPSAIMLLNAGKPQPVQPQKINTLTGIPVLSEISSQNAMLARLRAEESGQAPLMQGETYQSVSRSIDTLTRARDELARKYSVPADYRLKEYTDYNARISAFNNANLAEPRMEQFIFELNAHGASAPETATAFRLVFGKDYKAQNMVSSGIKSNNLSNIQALGFAEFGTDILGVEDKAILPEYQSWAAKLEKQPAFNSTFNEASYETQITTAQAKGGTVQLPGGSSLSFSAPSVEAPIIPAGAKSISLDVESPMFGITRGGMLGASGVPALLTQPKTGVILSTKSDANPFTNSTGKFNAGIPVMPTITQEVYFKPDVFGSGGIAVYEKSKTEAWQNASMDAQAKAMNAQAPSAQISIYQDIDERFGAMLQGHNSIFFGKLPSDEVANQTRSSIFKGITNKGITGNLLWGAGVALFDFPAVELTKMGLGFTEAVKYGGLALRYGAPEVSPYIGITQGLAGTSPILSKKETEEYARKFGEGLYHTFEFPALLAAAGYGAKIIQGAAVEGASLLTQGTSKLPLVAKISGSLPFEINTIGTVKALTSTPVLFGAYAGASVYSETGDIYAGIGAGAGTLGAFRGFELIGEKLIARNQGLSSGEAYSEGLGKLVERNFYQTKTYSTAEEAAKFYLKATPSEFVAAVKEGSRYGAYMSQDKVRMISVPAPGQESPFPRVGEFVANKGAGSQTGFSQMDFQMALAKLKGGEIPPMYISEPIEGFEFPKGGQLVRNPAYEKFMRSTDFKQAFSDVANQKPSLTGYIGLKLGGVSSAIGEYAVSTEGKVARSLFERPSYDLDIESIAYAKGGTIAERREIQVESLFEEAGKLSRNLEAGNLMKAAEGKGKGYGESLYDIEGKRAAHLESLFEEARARMPQRLKSMLDFEAPPRQMVPNKLQLLSPSFTQKQNEAPQTMDRLNAESLMTGERVSLETNEKTSLAQSYTQRYQNKILNANELLTGTATILKTETRQELQQGLSQNIKQNLKTDLRLDLKTDLRQNLRQNLKQELRTNLTTEQRLILPQNNKTIQFGRKKKNQAKAKPILNLRGSRTILADILSQTRSQLRYGKATSINTKRNPKAFSFDVAGFGRVPTMEQARHGKANKQDYSLRFGLNTNKFKNLKP